MKTETDSILSLTAVPYDQYNDILPVIRKRLGSNYATFESVLGEELPLTTARRAYRTAIMVAMGEEKVFREFEHQKTQLTKKV